MCSKPVVYGAKLEGKFSEGKVISVCLVANKTWIGGLIICALFACELAFRSWSTKELLRDFWCCRHRPVQHAPFSHIFLPFKTRENNRKNTRKLMTRSCPTLNQEVPPGFDLSSLNYKYPLQLTETVGRHFIQSVLSQNKPRSDFFCTKQRFAL